MLRLRVLLGVSGAWLAGWFVGSALNVALWGLS